MLNTFSLFLSRNVKGLMVEHLSLGRSLGQLGEKGNICYRFYSVIIVSSCNCKMNAEENRWLVGYRLLMLEIRNFSIENWPLEAYKRGHMTPAFHLHSLLLNI